MAEAVVTSPTIYSKTLMSVLLLQARRSAQDEECQQERSLRRAAEAERAALCIQLAQEEARRLAAEQKVWPHLSTCLMAPGML